VNSISNNDIHVHVRSRSSHVDYRSTLYSTLQTKSWCKKPVNLQTNVTIIRQDQDISLTLTKCFEIRQRSLHAR